MVVKQGLPRPLMINPKYLKNAMADIKGEGDRAEAERLILEEI
jgi:hypothetical protein